MGNDYYVWSIAEGWSQPADEFERQLRARWPEASVKLIEAGPDRPNAIEWQVPMTHNLLVGGFAREGTYLVLDGDTRDCAEVAAWFRSIVPDMHPLVFFCTEYSPRIELHRGIGPDEIVGPFIINETDPMNGYFFAWPFDLTSWSQPIDEVEEHLCRCWPDATVRRYHDEWHYPLEWNVSMAHGLLEGQVEGDGAGLVMRGNIHDCIEVALWLRELLPDEQPLIFCDTSHEPKVQLHRGMKAEEVAAPFLAKWGDAAALVGQSAPGEGRKID